MSPFAIFCVSMLCTADVAAESPAVAEIPVSAARRGSETRETYADVMRRAADRSQPDTHVIVPEMVELYVSLRSAPSLPHGEVAGMRRAIEQRLRVFHGRLVRQRIDAERSQRRLASRKPASEWIRARSEAEADAPSNAGGGAVAASAQQLIDLIQNTIEPDSWDVNGGKGRAMFYSPLNVLVIRNTGEVHEQIGGTLGQLRKIAP